MVSMNSPACNVQNTYLLVQHLGELEPIRGLASTRHLNKSFCQSQVSHANEFTWINQEPGLFKTGYQHDNEIDDGEEGTGLFQVTMNDVLIVDIVESGNEAFCLHGGL